MVNDCEMQLSPSLRSCGSNGEAHSRHIKCTCKISPWDMEDNFKRGLDVESLPRGEVQQTGLDGG